MRAVAYRMGRVLRRRWRATAALSVVVAAVTGVVLAFATGADRTASAPDRYTAERGEGFQAFVQQQDGRPRTAEVAALPGVAEVAAFTFVFGVFTRPDGSPTPDTIVFTGSHRAAGTRVVAGREPDPASAGEFVATRGFAEAKGVGLGARFNLLTLTQEQADRGGFESYAKEGALGPRRRAVLVGILDGPSELENPQAIAVLPPTLLDEPDVALSATIMSVRLDPGTDLAAFRSRLYALPNGDTLSVEPLEVVSAGIRTAVDGQAKGLWLLAAVGAIAAVAVLGQVVTRIVRLSPDERRRLEAIGFSRGQLLAEPVGRAGVPIVAGTLLGAGLAAALSGAFPTGFVRRIEPRPGLRIDPAVLAPCAAGLLAALLVWIVAALVVGRRARGGHPSALVESLATRSGRATVAVGLRFAFTRSRNDRGSVRATVAGLAGTVAVLVGAVVFGASLGRLVTDGARIGNNFEFFTGSGGDAVPDDLRATLTTDPDVAALMLYGVTQARVGPATIGLAGMEPVRGDLSPRMLAGRLPSAPDEIALGRLAARRLHAGVGTDLALERSGRVSHFRVTGLAVVPGIEGLDGVGQDSVVTMAGLVRLDPEAKARAAAIDLRHGAPPGTAARLGLGSNSDASVIVNLARLRSLPFLLAALVGALAVLTLVHVMVTSVRNRRRDIAVLRSLGADRRWITAAVHWQATALALVPLALGAPLGLIIGRMVFEAFAGNVGAVPDASFPFLRLAGVLGGLVLLANVVAAVPARRARRLSPSRLLTLDT